MRETIRAIHWVEICPEDSVIQILNNWALMLILGILQKSVSKLTTVRAALCEL